MKSNIINKNVRNWVWLAAIISCTITACKKLVDAGAPTTSITNEETFRTDASAKSAMAGLYSKMMYGPLNYANGAAEAYCGLSSDEFAVFGDNTLDPDARQFSINGLNSLNNTVDGLFWAPTYSFIYDANTIIEQVKLSTSSRLTDTVRKQLAGQAEFLRALSYFYLTNLFGDVPLVTGTDFHVSALMPNTPQPKIYSQMEQDLIDAQSKLPADYTSYGGRVQANKFAAAALLARVYLYERKWKDAESQSNSVIASDQYTLEDSLNHVFYKNSKESILQFPTLLPQATGTGGTYNILPIVNILFPLTGKWLDYDDFSRQILLSDVSTYNTIAPYLYPKYTLSPQAVQAFEPGDQRKIIWASYVDSPTGSPWNGAITYFMTKYVERPTIGTLGNQCYSVLRVGEQYLIRAEARAQQNNISGAASDLNKIRARAGLSPTTPNGSAAMLTAIAHERQVELMGEFGHRWLDLKRTGQATAVLGAMSSKTPFNNYQLLYPIPKNEVMTDPNLKQNTGY